MLKLDEAHIIHKLYMADGICGSLKLMKFKQSFLFPFLGLSGHFFLIGTVAFFSKIITKEEKKSAQVEAGTIQNNNQVS